MSVTIGPGFLATLAGSALAMTATNTTADRASLVQTATLPVDYGSLAGTFRHQFQIDTAVAAAQLDTLKSVFRLFGSLIGSIEAIAAQTADRPLAECALPQVRGVLHRTFEPYILARFSKQT
jgi:hypothetical protein